MAYLVETFEETLLEYPELLARFQQYPLFVPFLKRISQERALPFYQTLIRQMMNLNPSSDEQIQEQNLTPQDSSDEAHIQAQKILHDKLQLQDQWAVYLETHLGARPWTRSNTPMGQQSDQEFVLFQKLNIPASNTTRWPELQQIPSDDQHPGFYVQSLTQVQALKPNPDMWNMKQPDGSSMLAYGIHRVTQKHDRKWIHWLTVKPQSPNIFTDLSGHWEGLPARIEVAKIDKLARAAWKHEGIPNDPKVLELAVLHAQIDLVHDILKTHPQLVGQFDTQIFEAVLENPQHHQDLPLGRHLVRGTRQLEELGLLLFYYGWHPTEKMFKAFQHRAAYPFSQQDDPEPFKHVSCGVAQAFFYVAYHLAPSLI